MIKRLSATTKKVLVGTTALTLTIVSGKALHAGYKVNPPDWEVSVGNGYFQGGLSAARASTDGTQHIGCYVTWTGPANAQVTANFTSSAYAWCYGRDAVGNTRSCYVSTRYGLDNASVLSNLNQDSYLSVHYFNTSDVAYCSDFTIHNFSYNPLKWF